VLLELRRLLGGAVGLLSGVALEVDPSNGLTAVCDFLLTKAARQFLLSAPVVAVVEAKNDNLQSRLGQYIAEMYVVVLYNQDGSPITVVSGVVTTGSAWKFLRLEKTVVTLDLKEYYIPIRPMRQRAQATRRLSHRHARGAKASHAV